jgi:NAD(P)-dependent dehydrogenase (short-subunit alcohol dehydrogenase family)
MLTGGYETAILFHGIHHLRITSVCISLSNLLICNCLFVTVNHNSPNMARIRRKIRPLQSQRRPGTERNMKPRPQAERERAKYKLHNKVALITGGDSGIGRAIAILFAQEGADIALGYLSEKSDAKETKERIEHHNRKCLLLEGDISKEPVCARLVKNTIKKFGRIDILINNAAVQYEAKSIEDIRSKQMLNTFAVNIFSMFWLTKYAVPHMQKGSSIINTSSVTAYRGSPHMMDYAATKGAIVSFTRSLSVNLIDKGIRVNGVAPGPIWTPIIPASFAPDRVSTHGSDVPMERAGEPAEVAPSYLFLACDDSSFMSGQFLHPNGGEINNT